MELKFEGSTFKVRRDAAGILLECEDPKPHKMPAPGERVACPKAQRFEFEGEAFMIWRDPRDGIKFSRDYTAKTVAPREAAKSVAINVTSIVADRHALPARTVQRRAVAFNERASVPVAESVILCGREYWIWESPAGLVVERQRPRGGGK
jgi:hypothetical protein